MRLRRAWLGLAWLGVAVVRASAHDCDELAVPVVLRVRPSTAPQSTYAPRIPGR